MTNNDTNDEASSTLLETIGLSINEEMSHNQSAENSKEILNSFVDQICQLKNSKLKIEISKSEDENVRKNFDSKINLIKYYKKILNTRILKKF